MSQSIEQETIRRHINEFILNVHSTNREHPDRCNLQIMSKFSTGSMSLYCIHRPNDDDKPMHINSLKNLELNGSIDMLQDKRRRELVGIADLWQSCIKLYNKFIPFELNHRCKRMTFFTLTMSMDQVHTDQVIKREVLNSFIVSVKHQYGSFNYLWKAEKQENGRIHFHFLTDRFMDKFDLQSRWNRAQNKLGYIDRFKKLYNHDNPPSTHIRALSDNLGAAHYIFDYLAKDEKCGRVDGIKAGMSDSVRNLKPYEKNWNDVTIVFLLNFINTAKMRLLSCEFCFIMIVPEGDTLLDHFPLMKSELIDYQKRLTSVLYDDFVHEGIPGESVDQQMSFSH